MLYVVIAISNIGAEWNQIKSLNFVDLFISTERVNKLPYINGLLRYTEPLP